VEFPRSAIAEFKDGKLTGWTASQATHLLGKQLAAMLAMREAAFNGCARTGTVGTRRGRRH